MTVRDVIDRYHGRFIRIIKPGEKYCRTTRYTTQDFDDNVKMDKKYAVHIPEELMDREVLEIGADPRDEICCDFYIKIR